jgi:hypothetical protein
MSQHGRRMDGALLIGQSPWTCVESASMLDTKETTVLVSPNPQDLLERRPYEYDRTPRWSADGKSIAFVSWREDLPEAYVLQLP